MTRGRHYSIWMLLLHNPWVQSVCEQINEVNCTLGCDMTTHCSVCSIMARPV